MNKSIQLVQTYIELNDTLNLMQKDTGVTPLIFNKVLDTRSNIHSMIIDSLSGLNSKDTHSILNQLENR